MNTTEDNKKKIYNLWTIARDIIGFGLALTIPILVSFCTWAVQEIYDTKSYMVRENLILELKLKEYTDIKVEKMQNTIDHKLDKLINMIDILENRIDASPGAEWKEKIRNLELDVQQVKNNQTRILTILEKPNGKIN